MQRTRRSAALGIPCRPHIMTPADLKLGLEHDYIVFRLDQAGMKKFGTQRYFVEAAGIARMNWRRVKAGSRRATLAEVWAAAEVCGFDIIDLIKEAREHARANSNPLA